MEVIWIIPLYIICPLIGVVLVLKNLLKFKERQKKFYLGVFLISLPILHLLLIESLQMSLEKNIVGKYQLENKKDILTLNGDGTFKLLKTKEFGEAGNGRWEIYHIDSEQLNLKLENNDWLLLDIENENSEIKLMNNTFENELRGILVKQ
jgi:hypothetical protein